MKFNVDRFGPSWNELDGIWMWGGGGFFLFRAVFYPGLSRQKAVPEYLTGKPQFFLDGSYMYLFAKERLFRGRR
jgi:hypothetical protein